MAQRICPVRERPQGMHQSSQNTAGFITEKNILLICIFVNALPRVFAESSNTTGIAGRDKLSRQKKTNLASRGSPAFLEQ